jgi:hypothetical protein
MAKAGFLAWAALGLLGGVAAAQEPWSQPRAKWSPAFVTPELAVGSAAMEQVPKSVTPPTVVDPAPPLVVPLVEVHSAQSRVPPRPEPRPAPAPQVSAARLAPAPVAQLAENLPAPRVVKESAKPAPRPGPDAPVAENKPTPEPDVQPANGVLASVLASAGRLAPAPLAYMDPRTHAWTQQRIQPVDHLTEDDASHAPDAAFCHDRYLRGGLLDRWRHLVGAPTCAGACQ